MPSQAFENLKKRAAVTQPKATTSAFDALKSRSTAIQGQPANTQKAPANDVKGGIVGEIFTGNTQRFGKTTGEALAAPKNARLYEKSALSHGEIRNNLARQIHERRKQGEDVSRLEKILSEHVADAPTLEQFTGDVINKTTGQVLGEAAGTALEILPFGPYGKAAKAMKTGQLAAKSLPSVATGAIKAITNPKSLLTKATAKAVGEGAAFGYGVDVTQGLQDKQGAKSFKPGIGTAIGALAPVAVKGAGKLLGSTAERTAAKTEKLAAEGDRLASTIAQATPEDLKYVKNTLREVDLSKVKTYKEAEKTVDDHIKSVAGGLDNVLKTDPYIRPISELGHKVKVGNQEITTNYVEDALGQLKDYYTKINDKAKQAEILQLIEKGNKEGLSIYDINMIARKHGADLSGFNLNGELASGLSKQAAENTRKGIKATARTLFNNKIYNEADDTLTNLIRTRDLFSEMETKVNRAQNKARQLGLGEKALSLIEKAVNVGTLGTSRDAIRVIGRIAGGRTTPGSMTALEIEKVLQKNIKDLNEIIKPGQSSETTLKKLNNFIKDMEEVKPIKAPKKKSLPPVKNLISKTTKKESPTMGKIGNRQGGFISIGGKEESGLTTKILKDLQGKKEVSRQYILDATNRGELKQAERDITRQVLESMKGDKIDVAEFSKKVQGELLPLKIVDREMSGGGGTRNIGRYEHVTLPDDLKGDVESYGEHLFNSPVQTSAGDVHFRGTTGSENYFGHTRVEDMADKKTRRVIEVQSDLYQKGRLDEEALGFKTVDEYNKEYPDKKFGKEDRKKIAGIQRLRQYNDPTAHFRMIREEIRKAAQDGKTKLQFPTGETAMKVEGLGGNSAWFDWGTTNQLDKNMLKVGKEVSQGNDDAWIITSVLGDGKFKAVPANLAQGVIKKYPVNSKKYNELIEIFDKSGNAETFDISGKVDTNNPIYKFYEKDVRKYLNKYGGKEITDKQGVTWIEVPIKKEYDAPVEAFGKAQTGILFPIAGVTALGTIAAIPRKTTYENKTSTPSTTQKPPARYEEKDKSLLAAIVFGELSNKGDQKEEARKIINTVMNRVKETGGTIRDVVTARNQYQAYGTDQFMKALTGELDHLSAKKKKLVDEVIEELYRGELKDNTLGSVFYVHDKDGNLILRPGKLRK